MRKFIMSGLLWLLLGTSVALSQDSLKFLNEVVITASRTEQEIINASRTVEVISSEELRQTSFSSLGQLLSAQTGMFVVGAFQTPGTNQDVFLRGANSNHVAILIDGVRVTDPSTPNSAFNLAELSLANVERIEIVHGAHSTLYGTSAIGGVINIITKKGEKGFSGNVSLQGGGYDGGNLLEGSTFLSYGFDNGFYVTGSAFHQQVDGLDASIDTLESAGFATNDSDDFEKTDFSLKVGNQNEHWDNFIEYKRASQMADIDDGAFNDDHNYILDLDREFLNYRLGYTKDNWSLQLNGGFTTSEREAVNDSSIIDNSGTYDQEFFSSSFRADVLTNEVIFKGTYEKLTMVAGAGDYRERMDFQTYFFTDGPFGPFESITNYDSLDLNANIQYAFISGNYTFSEPVNISFGIRYNDHNLFGDELTYELSPSYKPGDNTTLYASYSRGFNAPSLTQLYDPNPGVITTRGNANLQPEVSDSYEIGLKQFLKPNIALSFSGFYNHVKQAIEYVYIWNGQTEIDNLGFADFLGDTYINLNDQDIMGIEWKAEASFGQWDLSLNGTYLSTSFTTDLSNLEDPALADNHLQIFANGAFVEESAGEEFELSRRPSLLLNGAVAYSINNNISLRLQHQYIGNRNDSFYDPSLGPFGALNALEMSDFHLLNLTTFYRVNDKLLLNLSVNNLLDEHFSEIRGFNTLGRNVFLKISYEL